MRIFVVLSAMLLIAADPADEATRRWWAHVKILAADNMEGRDTGSEGYRRAARSGVTSLDVCLVVRFLAMSLSKTDLVGPTLP